MSDLNIHCATSADSLAQELAADVAEQLKLAIQERQRAILVVSGGSTPKPFFFHLSNIELDWENVLVTLADERCVAPEDSQSNARLVKEHLLQNAAADAQFLPLFDGVEASETSAETISGFLSGLPTYDVVILGMGGDGHTASIFPEASNRSEALDHAQEASALLIDPITVTPLRITQTAVRLLNTRFLVLHTTGQEKARLLESILAQPDSERWPISHFLQQHQTPARIYSDCEIAG